MRQRRRLKNCLGGQKMMGADYSWVIPVIILAIALFFAMQVKM